MFLFPILLLILVYFVFIKDQNVHQSIYRKSPEDKLKERYVSGEIDEDTYLRMLRTIKE